MKHDRTAPPKAWAKGTSGNPTGRPTGSRNKTTVMALKLMNAGAKEIIETVIIAAKGGDLTAAKMVLDRLVPPAKERPVNVNLPDTITAEGIAQAQAVILQAVADGDLLPSEGATLAGIVEARRKAIETQELEQRIAILEERAMATLNQRLQVLEGVNLVLNRKTLDEMTDDELIAVIVAGLCKLEAKPNRTEKENRQVALLDKFRRGENFSRDDLLLIAGHAEKPLEDINHG